MTLRDLFREPPREYSLVPFWFLNDNLSEEELIRQINDFETHGVYGFIPHPRIGLPKSIAFCSKEWFRILGICVEQAARKGMFVILYDEGMYPSGSCGGQVVAANPRFAARCIQRRKPDNIEDDEEILFQDEEWVYVHTRSRGTIRGLHWDSDDGQEAAPPAADLLNPDATATFRRFSLDRHYEELKPYFGGVIRGIFTDEPSLLGRNALPNALPWTWGFDCYLKEQLGYDFLQHLPALFDASHQDHSRVERDFLRAVNRRLAETYYAPYSQWCEKHGVSLTGHPAGPCDIGFLKYFHIPGQDVVWRYIEPFKDNALTGAQSTMAKCSSSAQRHYGRARNLNECFGAYGWELTYDEMLWITNWLLIRGVNMLVPHAFYYSLRGNRRNERPPDVGPNSPWWNNYKRYADYCRRLCWLLSEGRHVCEIAVLADTDSLPWRAARVLLESQRDFNYLDRETLLRECRVSAENIQIRDMMYRVLLVDGATGWDEEVANKVQDMSRSGRVIAFPDPIEGISHAKDCESLSVLLNSLVPPDVSITPRNPNLRYIHLRHQETDFYVFANEGKESIQAELSVASDCTNREWWDPETGLVVSKATDQIILAPFQILVLNASIHKHLTL